MSQVVGVHGIAQQQLGRHALRTPWRDAVADGLERAGGRRVEAPDVDVAFYGDLVVGGAHPGGSKGAAVADDLAELGDMTPAELAFVQAAAGEVFSAAELEATGGGSPKGFPALPPGLLQVVAALDRRFGAHAGTLFVGELRQVRRYLSDPELRDAVDARVAATVAPGAAASRCRVLIGHSLGSVVAVEYLRRHPDHPVRMLLTVGSPLGLRAVRALLADPDHHGDVVPVPVGRWVNLWDRRDPVALAGGLSRWWAMVEDDDTVDNGRDPHSARRYLSKRHTGAALLAALPALVGSSVEPDPTGTRGSVGR